MSLLVKIKNEGISNQKNFWEFLTIRQKLKLILKIDR